MRSADPDLQALGFQRDPGDETFNLLKTKGYRLEHNFGHGKEKLSALLATMNLLAFALHSLCEILESLWIKARETLGARRRFFEHLRTITSYFVFPTSQTRIRSFITGQAPPARAGP